MSKLLLLSLVCLLLSLASYVDASDEPKKPNVILIFVDDQGYNDLGCFGAKGFKTPNIDQLASEGTRFTSFYSAASVCTPSRASLLTGCYPERVGNLPVLFPRSFRGLNPDETTIPEMLKVSGYQTACFGKWHLGHHKPFLPTNHGFDQYFGIPYSNDMGVDATMELADDARFLEGKTRDDFFSSKEKLPPLMSGNKADGVKVVEWPADQRTLTKRYTEKTVGFIRESVKNSQPFFVYLPYTMPHIPLYVTGEFRGKSDSGLYGDTIEEIDSNVGKIMDTVRELSIEKNTIVIYTTDNGPWNLKGNATDKVKGNMNRRIGGSAFPLKGFKFSNWEGGMRVPAVIWGPGHVAANGVCDQICGTIDLLPTIAAMTQSELPDKKIDGKNITKLLVDPKSESPHEAYFYRKEGVRKGKWKLKGKQLFDLESDISESTDLATVHPKVFSELKELLENHRADLAKNARTSGTIQGKRKRNNR